MRKTAAECARDNAHYVRMWQATRREKYRTALLEGYEGAIRELAAYYANGYGEDFDDLKVVGQLAVIYSIEHYDEDRDGHCGIGTFVINCIRYKMLNHLKGLHSRMRDNRNDISLQQEVSRSRACDAPYTLEDVYTSPSEGFEDAVLTHVVFQDVLRRVGAEMPQNLAAFLDWHRGDTLREIGARCGCAGERVRQRIERAKREMGKRLSDAGVVGGISEQCTPSS